MFELVLIEIVCVNSAVHMGSQDDRTIEVFAMGLHIQQGAQLADDITFEIRHGNDKEPCLNGATTNKAAFQLVRQSRILGVVGR